MRLLAFVALAAASALPAAAAPSLALGTGSAQAPQSVSLPVTFTADGTVVAAQFELVYDPAALTPGTVTKGAAIAATDHVVSKNVVAAGRLRVIVLSNSLTVLPSGVIADVAFTVNFGAAAGARSVSFENVELPNASAVKVAPTGLGSGSVTVLEPPCSPGDVAPDGVGDGSVQTADFVLARRKALGLAALTARDTSCGDISPGSVVCVIADGADAWCPAPDGAFQPSDVLVLRRFVLGIQTTSCTACGQAPAPSTVFRPADLAPRGASDGRIDVADVVVALRLAVGLDLPSDDERLQADVAPASPAGQLSEARGNGQVDVADVVLTLRAAVGLDALAWPARELVVRHEGAGAYVAALVVVEGVPRWAELESGSAPACEAAGGESEATGEGARWALLCVTDPATLSGPEDVALLRYRAPRALDPSALRLSGEVLASDLSALPTALTAFSR